jgi:cardiolipin synthase
MMPHISRGLRRATIILGVTLLAGLTACASPPDFDEVNGRAAAGPASPRLSGVRGPLTQKQSGVILDRLRRENPSSDILQRHLAFEEAIASSPLTVGNKITLLRDGEATIRSAFHAIAGAKDHIQLDYYIFEDIEEDEVHLADLLVERQRAGVQVNLIYDGHGSRTTPSDLFERLRQAGARTLEFHPLNPLTAAEKGYSINDRDHRKILIADGTTAIVGGVNLSKVYVSSGLRREVDEADKPQEQWRDTALQIEGPAVAELQRLFLRHWNEESGEPLPERNYFPPAKTVGNQVVRVIGSTPQDELPQFYVTLLSAIRTAENRIWLTAAYFVPTHQELEALEQAAQRGVDVRLLLAGQTDSPVVQDAGRSHYDDLLKAGVRIYELRDVILHSKSAVIDGVWSVVGSSNFDGRSVLFNDEVDAVVLGRETAAQLEAAFEQDVNASDQVDLQTWRERPLGRKLREFLSRLWSYWL